MLVMSHVRPPSLDLPAPGLATANGQNWAEALYLLYLLFQTEKSDALRRAVVR